MPTLHLYFIFKEVTGAWLFGKCRTLIQFFESNLFRKLSKLSFASVRAVSVWDQIYENDHNEEKFDQQLIVCQYFACSFKTSEPDIKKYELVLSQHFKSANCFSSHHWFFNRYNFTLKFGSMFEPLHLVYIYKVFS